MTDQPLCIIGCMIVKNEEPVMVNTLNAFASLVDYWIISDTGSTDDTIPIIRKWFGKHSGEICRNGEVHEHQWVNFSVNRNNVAGLAKQYQSAHSDLVCFNLSIDAGDDNVGADNLRKILQEHKPIVVRFTTEIIQRQQSILRSQTHIVRCFKTSYYPQIQWISPIHEYLNIPDDTAQNYVCDDSEFKLIHDYSKDTSSSGRYTADLKILKKEVRAARKTNDTTTDWHAYYYIAQTYSLLGKRQYAIDYLNEWLKRAESRDAPKHILNILCLRVKYSRFENLSYITAAYKYAQQHRFVISDLESLRRIATAYFLVNLRDNREYAFEMISKVTRDTGEIEKILQTFLAHLEQHNLSNDA